MPILSPSDLTDMRRYYEQRLTETSARVNHIRTTLAKLDELQGSDTGNMPLAVSQADRTGKRGRRSIWGDFILRSLETYKQPLYFSQIIQLAQTEFNIPDEKLKVLKAAINQASFRLRTVHKKIETIGVKGQKAKQLILSEWLNDKGEVELPGR